VPAALAEPVVVPVELPVEELPGRLGVEVKVVVVPVPDVP
jgi:hypothetical protein